MGQALNTTVNGSSGTCDIAADWLRSLATAGHQAAGNARGAHTSAESGWQGPASTAFQNSIDRVDRVSDDMADRASTCERGLREFAASLDNVVARMQESTGKAQGGGLRVDGPFIVEPEPVPMNQPGTPAEVCTADGGTKVIGQYQGDINKYNVLVGEYNAKIAVYNDCKATVDAARTTEGNAHQALQQAMQPPHGDINLEKLGTTTISRVLSYVSSFENPRMENLLKAQRAGENANFYETWAMGSASTWTDQDKAAVKWAEDNSRGNRFQYQTKAQQYAQFVEKVPEDVRKFIAAYPGKRAYHVLPPDADLGLKAGRQLLKGMPYVGSTLTIGTEAMNAWKGEETWGKAAANSGGLIAGGALGAAGLSAAVAAAYGAPLGPLGAFVTGTVGGVAGAIGGQAVVDFLVPK